MDILIFALIILFILLIANVLAFFHSLPRRLNAARGEYEKRRTPPSQIWINTRTGKWESAPGDEEKAKRRAARRAFWRGY